MAIEVRKKDRETTGSLLRRFTRRVQQSGVLLRARRIRFYEKPKTKRAQKESAWRREELHKLRQELIKARQLKEDEMIPQDKIRKQ